MKPLIIIPARVGSVRVKHKNFRRLPDGTTLIDRAVACARKLKGQIVVSTDHPTWTAKGVTVIRRDPELATADTSTRAVVNDVLDKVSGPASQVVVLLQPTTPYRNVDAIRQMMRDADPRWSTVTTYATKAFDFDHLAWLSCSSYWKPVHVITGEAYVFVRDMANRFPAMWHEHETHTLPMNIDTPAQWRALCRQVRLEMRANRR